MRGQQRVMVPEEGKPAAQEQQVESEAERVSGPTLTGLPQNKQHSSLDGPFKETYACAWIFLAILNHNC